MPTKRSRPTRARSRKPVPPSPPPLPTFSQDDLLAALAEPIGEGGRTSGELGDAISRPQAWVTLRLRELWKQNAVEMVKARRTDMIGVLRFVPTYRLKRPLA